MPCSKPIRRKYSKNEVILPSDRRGSMACHAVPRVMMYQGDARVPLEAEAILRGLRWWRTEVWNNGCFVRLGRCGIVIWRLIAHYYYWAGTSGVRPPCCSALLFGAWHVDPVAICPTCRREDVYNSWKQASTEEYKTWLGFCCFARSIDTTTSNPVIPTKTARPGLFPRDMLGGWLSWVF